MKLEFAKNLRELRLRRDLTQDELAEQLGVSVQTVSRWESSAKTSYPDIELLPTIAGFFGVTVDELLGCSKAQSDERLAKYWEEADAVEDDGNKRVAILRKMHEEYPNDFDVMYSICETGALHGSDRYDPENVALVRECSTRILEECTNKFYRERAAVAIVIIEDEDKLDDVLGKYTSDTDISRYQLLEWRYARKPGEAEKYKDVRQRNFLSCISGCLSIKSGNTSDLSISEYRAWHSKMQLGIIDALTDIHSNNPISGDGEVDLWSGYRIYCGISLARGLCCMGKTDEALDILDDTAALAEKVCSIPAGTTLTFRCPGLDSLSSTVELSAGKYYVNDAPIIVATVNAREHHPGLSFSTGRAYTILTKSDDFADIRDTDRFKMVIERFRIMAEIK